MKRYPARRQSGFVLLAVMVFMLVAALLALGDMRTLTVQQTLVASLYAAENAMAETESALSTMEQFAAYEGAELVDGWTKGARQRTPPPLTNTNTSSSCTANTEPATSCFKASCNSFLYPKSTVTGDDNVTANTSGKYRQERIGTSKTECSFCAPPTLGCKARWDELPGTDTSPWAAFHVNFYRSTTTNPKDNVSPRTQPFFTKKFYGMVEYLGWAPCNLTDLAPNGTNLDVYDTAAAADQSRGCRVMRVTVRNQPPVVSAPVITLQSTILVTSALFLPGYGVPNPYKNASDALVTPTDPMPNCCYPAASAPPASAISKTIANPHYTVRGIIDAERISWRQIFPN